MTTHPRLVGDVREDVENVADAWPVPETEIGFSNDYLKVTVDTIVDPAGDNHSRVVVRPRGAVAVAAIDEFGRILLVQQFRHAVQSRMIEIPAGILDVEGEAPADAAARELAEEADLVAHTWSHVLHLNTTPGFCSERIDVYLASDLEPVAESDRVPREAEEAGIQHWWVPIENAVEAVSEGRITDAKTVAAILLAGRP